MIQIERNLITDDSIQRQYPAGSTKWQIAKMITENDAVYSYPSMKFLEFELDARKELVNASERLNNSFFSFRLFKDSMCNANYWDRTREGGFRLKKEVKPHEAVRDIYKNSRLYGTECATAIVIVFYMALVEVLPPELFDNLFSDIYLMDWKYLDKDLGVHTYRNVRNALPGDCLYFKNPDVNPDTPEWQGENVIMLLNGYYYGHGIGIKTSNEILRDLNRNRAYGSETPAYLMDQIVKPDFIYLASRYFTYTRDRNQ
ncbi:MAG: protein-glutamine gamma-glutamyltransferase [Clostridiaceae bacterium]|jgi:protein-glutamine gamma-glutamyltransferase|nr:protein-glutamine gamma-glutamyltransferase [Clostridiaceae bacterium]